MTDIEQTSSNEVMENASQTSSPSLTAPVPPRVVSESFSRDSQAPVTPTNENETLEVKSHYSQFVEGVTGISWDSLSDTRKCLFAFLCLRNQISILYNKKNQNVDAVSAALERALTPGNNPEYLKLEAFIRKGGDRKGDDCHELYQNFKQEQAVLAKLTLIGGEYNGFSIFEAEAAGGHVLRPLFRFQTDPSVVCFLICAANAISYTMELRNHSTPQEAFQQYSINIGRYMRNKLSDETINACVFDENGGGYPEDILEDLLTPVTDVTGKRTKEIDTDVFDFDPQTVFGIFKYKLEKYGPIMFSSFKIFQAFADPNKTLFAGDWNDIEKFKGRQCYHAILITGVHMISDGSYGGVLFEAQDSLRNRPFVYLGFDLLKSMGEQKMNFIKEEIAFCGTPPAYAYGDGDTPQNSYLSGVQSPVSGQEEERLTLSKDIVSVRKKLVSPSEAVTPDWLGLDGFDRNHAIIT